MDSLQILILSIVQGLTEFLPISSSAHLILTPMLFGYTDQGLAFDVAVHLGSLLAVTTYFRHELILMAGDFFRSLKRGAPQTENSRMVWMIILATLPIIVAGELFISLVQHDLRSTGVIAATTILFGLLLFWYDRQGSQSRDEYSISWRDALTIGLFQVLALIPGTSRSGITMTAGMMLGLTREATSRFSFLLSIPTILMSGSMVTLDLVTHAAPVNWLAMGSGALLSFASAYICIHYFLQLINKISMLPFVIYRLLLGSLLVWLAI
ncbi:undecaprenyl-diphosphate phosphatase [Sedimenticola selenatireducens]|uniref:Undecaprenyl-diphosphatase n=1 Tax=Sedimenticola selenatireducens TaxID=191960 RepID=A0A558DVB6_9GAMM|nr:undecaprenyl-diphosphate phosphatase [Sedimenticola selenatireducens]TVO77671.1 undecaprenyl-diphosphate phosphatase [Sedimenticola selenatireducens]TVT64977.1 MAG: undecaprenyl-diphosphate phosphatase [Sedimenticola selenatireducens]